MLPATGGFLFPVAHNALPCLGHEQRKHGAEVFRVGGVRVVAGRLHRLQLLVGQRLGCGLLAEKVERKSISTHNNPTRFEVEVGRWNGETLRYIHILENAK